MASEQVDLRMLRTDGGTQPRAGLVETKVDQYAEMMADGVKMDPLFVIYDGSAYWLVDGFHRLAAARRVGCDFIACDVRPGTLADAQWASYGVNARHGLERTAEDKRRAVLAALQHPNSALMSDRAIAVHCGVGNRFVGVCRKELPNCARDTVGRRTGLDGKSRRMPVPKVQSAQDARWPVPNRFGVFEDAANAIEVKQEHDGSTVRLRVLRIGESAWAYAFAADLGPAGTGGPLSTSGAPEPTYEDAIGAAACQAAEWMRETRASSTTTGTMRRQIACLLAWLCSMGAPPEVIESGPATTTEAPLTIPPESAGEPMPLRHYREMQRVRAGHQAPPAPLSPDAAELQRAMEFLARDLAWLSLAAELGLTDVLRQQALQGRDALDLIWRKAVDKLSA